MQDNLKACVSPTTAPGPSVAAPVGMYVSILFQSVSDAVNTLVDHRARKATLQGHRSNTVWDGYNQLVLLIR